MARLGHKMVRYADDSVILCRDEEEAKRALEEMKGMLEARGLTLQDLIFWGTTLSEG